MSQDNAINDYTDHLRAEIERLEVINQTLKSKLEEMEALKDIWEQSSNRHNKRAGTARSEALKEAVEVAVIITKDIVDVWAPSTAERGYLESLGEAISTAIEALDKDFYGQSVEDLDRPRVEKENMELNEALDKD